MGNNIKHCNNYSDVGLDNRIDKNINGEKRLLFQRDKAGFNNVRITFESLVCVAALTKRQLVIPPPSSIDHMSEQLFHELQVYDAKLLATAVSCISGASAPLKPTFIGSFDDYLRASRLGELEDMNDVVLDPEKTRIQHFECLKLPSTDARLAANTVLKLRFAPTYEHDALKIMKYHDLIPGSYHAVHLRRGDFARFRPETQWSGSDLQGRVVSAFPTAENHLPLVVACVYDEKEKDPFPELVVAFESQRRVIRTDELWGAKNTPLHTTVLDTILLTKARRFAGTPDSTFSTGIWHWRALERVLSGDINSLEKPIGLAPLKLPSEGKCWQRCTTFEALK